MKKNENINSLVNVFLSIREGNDCYTLKYHILCLIFKLANKDIKKVMKDLSLVIDEGELYNLQYNYEHFSNSNREGSTRFIMSDWQNNEIGGLTLETNIQKIMNKLHLLLAEVLKEYEFSIGFK